MANEERMPPMGDFSRFGSVPRVFFGALVTGRASGPINLATDPPVSAGMSGGSKCGGEPTNLR